MTIHTIRPNGTLVANNWTAHGAVDQATAASDASDSSYVQSTDVNEIKFQFSEYALATNERCSRIRAKMRTASADGTSATQMAIGVILGDTTGWLPGNATIAAALTEYDASVFATTAGGTEWTQGALNSIQARIFAYGTTGGVTPKLMDVWVDLDVRTRATVAIPTITATYLASVTDTHAPIVAWTPTINDGQAQVAYQVKLYDLSVTPSPNPDTSPPGWDTSGVDGALTSRRLPPLRNGNYRVFVRVAKDFNGSHWWSDWTHTDVTVNVNPATPTALTPAAASTQNTNTPAVHCVMPTPPTDNAAVAPNKTTPEWMFARDAGFTTSVLSVFQTDSSGATVWHSYATAADSDVPVATPLGIGTWYVRVRAKDFYGGLSAWSAAQQFTISHPPSATVVSPTGGQVVAYDGVNGNAFDWTFYSTSPDELQTAYELIIEDNIDGSTVVDTGKVVSSIAEAYVIVPATYKDQSLRWKVKVWDSDDTPATTYSGYGIFQVSDLPTVTLSVSPNPATSPQPTISWTLSGSSGRSQVAYRIALFDALENLIYDTNKVIDNTTTSLIVPDPTILKNSSSYSAYIVLWDNYGLTNNATYTFTTSWTPPAAPAFSVDPSFLDTSGFVLVSWDDSATDPAWFSWRVYRREVGKASWDLLAEDTSVQTTHWYRDFFVKNNWSYEYMVVQVAIEFGAQVESTYAPKTITTAGSHYWLVSEADVAATVKLPLVKEDSFTEEYETSEYTLVGRGRKIDFGDRWGFRGSLTAQLRDDPESNVTAAQMSAAIQSAKAERADAFLRTPFGHLWQVVTTDIQFTRVAGSGGSEWLDVQIPYVEVA